MKERDQLIAYDEDDLPFPLFSRSNEDATSAPEISVEEQYVPVQSVFQYAREDSRYD